MSTQPTIQPIVLNNRFTATHDIIRLSNDTCYITHYHPKVFPITNYIYQDLKSTMSLNSLTYLDFPIKKLMMRLNKLVEYLHKKLII